MMIRITVTLNDFSKTYGAAIDLREVIDRESESFRPIRETDNFAGRLCGDHTAFEAIEIRRKRKIDADRLAKMLSEHLVNAMGADDTMNGYPLTKGDRDE